MAKKSDNKKFVYKHKQNGKYLEFRDMGDGEISLGLVDKIDKDCVLEPGVAFGIEEAIEWGDGQAELSGGYIIIIAEDFEEIEAEINIVLK